VTTVQQLQAVLLVKRADWVDFVPFVGSGRDTYQGVRDMGKATGNFINDLRGGQKDKWQATKDWMWNHGKGGLQAAMGTGGLALDTLTMGLGSIPKNLGVGAAKWLGKGLARTGAVNAAIGGAGWAVGKIGGGGTPVTPQPSVNTAPQPIQDMTSLLNTGVQAPPPNTFVPGKWQSS